MDDGSPSGNFYTFDSSQQASYSPTGETKPQKFLFKGKKLMKPDFTTSIAQLAFKAIALATSIAVIVLNVLGTMPLSTSVTLLAIGLFCLAILQFQKP
jgi:hypothetical protein